MKLSEPMAKKIFRSYKKSADAKDTNFMLRVGKCYSAGYGVTKDKTKALEWCVDAAKVGSEDAMIYLADNWEIGEIPIVAETVFSWYLTAAKNNHLKAMYKVIYCYFDGSGTEKDEVKCGHWISRYDTQRTNA